MKRISILLIAILFLTSCNKNTTQDEITPTPDILINMELYDDHLVYPTESVRCYATDENNMVYTVDEYGDSTSSTDEFVSTIGVYDLNGEKKEEYTIKKNGGIDNICVGDGKLYLVSWTQIDSKSVQALYCYDLSTRDIALLTPLDMFSDDFLAIKKIAYLDNRVYILGISPEYADDEYDLWEGDYFTYQYDGTILMSYNISEDIFEIVFDGVLHNFSLTPDRTIMLYAHDSEGGFYFQTLDPSSDFMLGDKVYRGIHHLHSFAADSDGIVFAEQSAVSMLSYCSLTEDSGIVEIMPDVNISSSHNDSIVYCNGFTFYLNQSGKLERIENSAYIKDNPSIKMILSADYGVNLFAEGYSVETTRLDYNIFALTVLSRDTSYDICYLGSRQDFATNIKDKGSFYPLNDVPGVQEFLDACFPYIKDAAVDATGNIWMIPVNVSVDAIIYQKDNCEKAGIDFAAASTVEDIIYNVRKAVEYEPTNSNYTFNQYSLLQRTLISYLRNNEVLDTPEFRKIASVLKSLMTERVSWGTGLPFLNTDRSVNTNFLFDNASVQTSHHLIERDDLYAIPVTGTDEVSSAYCVFLCVNPDSSNLQYTLDYISSVCEYLMTLNDSFMLSDPATYTDSDYARRLYALYENSVIDFNISDEVFANDFDRYLQGEIDIDTMIAEADRKLAMYRGE